MSNNSASSAAKFINVMIKFQKFASQAQLSAESSDSEISNVVFQFLESNPEFNQVLMSLTAATGAVKVAKVYSAEKPQCCGLTLKKEQCKNSAVHGKFCSRHAAAEEGAKAPLAKMSDHSCSFILTRGVRKSMECGKKCREGQDYCTAHLKSKTVAKANSPAASPSFNLAELKAAMSMNASSSSAGSSSAGSSSASHVHSETCGHSIGKQAGRMEKIEEESEVVTF